MGPSYALSTRAHQNGTGKARKPIPGIGAPINGRSFFAWCKDRGEEHDVDLTKYLSGWGKLQDFPGKILDWNPEQVAAGHAEAVRKLESLVPV